MSLPASWAVLHISERTTGRESHVNYARQPTECRDMQQAPKSLTQAKYKVRAYELVVSLPAGQAKVLQDVVRLLDSDLERSTTGALKCLQSPTRQPLYVTLE